MCFCRCGYVQKSVHYACESFELFLDLAYVVTLYPVLISLSVGGEYIYRVLMTLGVNAVDFCYVAVHVALTYMFSSVVISWRLHNWQKVSIYGGIHSKSVWSLSLEYKCVLVLRICLHQHYPYSEMGQSIDHDATPVCCWRQIPSREHFCNWYHTILCSGIKIYDCDLPMSPGPISHPNESGNGYKYW